VSIFSFAIILIKNNSNTPKSSGSVGRDIPIPPKSKLSKLNDKGVQKTMRSNNFSNEKNAKKTTVRSSGNRPSKKNSLAKRKAFSNTKIIVSNTS